jgi:hypothetical protein
MLTAVLFFGGFKVYPRVYNINKNRTYFQTAKERIMDDKACGRKRIHGKNQRQVDIPKVKQALSIKSIVDSIPVIGGGIALLCLNYPFWGIMCVLAGSCGVFSNLPENKAPKLGRIISNAQLPLEIITLIAGGIVLIMLGQVAGGIACICVCAARTVMSVFFLPLIEKKYLTVYS